MTAHTAYKDIAFNSPVAYNIATQDVQDGRAGGPLPEGQTAAGGRPTIAVRSYFPETWLWKLQRVG